MRACSTFPALPKAAPSLLLVALLQGACLAPVSLGSPDRSKTVGRGEIGVTGRAEMPSINLISAGNKEDFRTEGILAPVVGGELAFGVHERVDLEAGLEMPLYFLILPIPNGIWGGARVGLAETESFEVALAGRIGGLALPKVEGDVETDETASASFGAIGLSASANTGSALRPGVALRFTYYDVSTEGVDNAAANFVASTASINVYVGLRFGNAEILPYLNVARFYSGNLEGGSASIVGGGLAFRIGSRSSAPEPPMDPGF